MERQTELSLIDELLALKAEASAFLDEAVAHNPVELYTSQARFTVEQHKLFRTLPNAVAHMSELAEPGAFLRRDVGGLPALITRDKSGSVNAFLNVCRHRGTRLVDEEAGCKHRFSCPYHAWTYASTGELIAAPHFEDGFPGTDKADLSLIRLNCEERHGLVWVWQGETFSLADWFGDLDTEFAGLGLSDMKIAAEDKSLRRANWKVLVEGGIEAYHFRVAHRHTIGPHFEDNLSSYQLHGAHMRSVLPRTSMGSLSDETRETWRIRDHANILYTFFPSSQFLVMQDHIVWISSAPKSPGETLLRLVTLAPTKGPDADGKDDEHWKRNHAITMTTLDEDFVIGESIQESIAAGANTHMTFGRFEGALDQFNRTVEQFVGS